MQYLRLIGLVLVYVENLKAVHVVRIAVQKQRGVALGEQVTNAVYVLVLLQLDFRHDLVVVVHLVDEERVVGLEEVQAVEIVAGGLLGQLAKGGIADECQLGWLFTIVIAASVQVHQLVAHVVVRVVVEVLNLYEEVILPNVPYWQDLIVLPCTRLHLHAVLLRPVFVLQFSWAIVIMLGNLLDFCLHSLQVVERFLKLSQCDAASESTLFVLLKLFRQITLSLQNFLLFLTI